MHVSKSACAIVAMALIISGCSTRPRNFAATTTIPVADRTVFETDYRTCQRLVAHGRRTDFKAAAATGAATGAGAFGASAVAASAGGIGIGGATAVASIAIPFVGVLAGFGVSRTIRGGKERKIKRAMTTCLTEYGYSVAGWSKLKRREDAAHFAALSSVAAPAPLASNEE